MPHITVTLTTMEVQLLNILVLINSNILMPRLVVHDGVCMLQGDIFLEPNSYVHIIQIPYSGSSVQLIFEHVHYCLQCGWTSNILMHDVYTNGKVWASGDAHQLVKVRVKL